MYSRRLTNDIRDYTRTNCYAHLDSERAKNPLQIELNEKIDILVERFLKLVYEHSMPEEDFNVIMKYKNQSEAFRVWLRKCTDDNGRVYYEYSTWGECIKLISIRLPRFVYYDSAEKIINMTYKSFDEKFIADIYELAYILKCEEEKAKASIKTILQRFSTTGKLVEAYPEMEKFIPAQFKTKEERNDSKSPAERLNLDVDLTTLLN
jgi:hypothetical protein